MRTLPILAIALMAAAPAFAATPVMAPAGTNRIVLATGTADPRAARDLSARANDTVSMPTTRAAVADATRNEDIDYPSQIGPEGPRASR
jgi:hypothetical protein